MWAKANVSKLPYCHQTAVLVTVIVNVTVTVVNAFTVAVEVTLFATAHDFLLGTSGWLVIFMLVDLITTLPDF